MIREFHRLLRISLLLAAYYVHSLAAKIAIRDPVARRRFFAYNTGRYSARLLNTMGFKITRSLSRPDLFARNYLVVSNHLSYLDILVMSSCFRAVFVTSTEVRDMTLLGDLCEFGGSLFVDRRNPKRVLEDAKMVGTVLGQGFNIVIYPEGTTTNGETVTRFKSSLLSPAVSSNTPILPLCIRYKSINGAPFSDQNRDYVCWYGDMSFPPHFYNLRRLFDVEVELSLLEPIEVTPESNRRDLAQRAEEMIRATYHQSQVAAPGEEEFDYRAAASRY